jgi:hypothetical protein
VAEDDCAMAGAARAARTATATAAKAVFIFCLPTWNGPESPRWRGKSFAFGLMYTTADP